MRTVRRVLCGLALLGLGLTVGCGKSDGGSGEPSSETRGGGTAKAEKISFEGGDDRRGGR